MTDRAEQPPLFRTEPAQGDLDWLPPSLKAVRWIVAGSVWGGLTALIAGISLVGRIHLFWFWKSWLGIGAAGYYAGDRLARAALRHRLRKLAHGAIDLSQLAQEPDGELYYLRGRVKARTTLPGLLDGEPAVFRRMVIDLGDSRLVHEAAVDFAVIDEQGAIALVEVAGARLVARDRSLLPLPPAARERVLGLGIMTNLHKDTWSVCFPGRRRDLPAASEVLLRDGDAVEIVGYKSRAVDPTLAARLPRDIPFRPTLRSGRALPLLVAVASRKG